MNSREPRAVRRRDQLRADSVHREDTSAGSGRVGALRCTAARPAGGKRSARRCSTRTTTTARAPAARTRSTSARTPSSTSTRRERVLQRRPVAADADARRTATISVRRSATLEQTNRLELVLGTQVAVGRAVGHLGGGLLARRRRRLSEAHLGQAHRRDRQEGRRVLAGPLRSRPHHAARLGDARTEAARARSHIYVGAVGQLLPEQRRLLAEDFLKSATNPPADAKVDYGMRDEHCWSGDHDGPNAFSRLTLQQALQLPQIVARWLKTAPPGADTKSWRY